MPNVLRVVSSMVAIIFAVLGALLFFMTFLEKSIRPEEKMEEQ